MSKSNRSGRDADRSAKRARRLAERKERRARRAAERAEYLADRAKKKARSSAVEQDLERSIEDFVEGIVDDITTKFTCQADGSTCYMGTDTGKAESGESESVSDNNNARHKASRRRRHSSRRRSSLRGRVNSGRGLYRDTRHKRILGVCAGVADYLEIERWQARLVAALFLVFMPSVALTVYFIAFFLMEKKPYYREFTDRYAEDDLYDDDEDEGMVRSSAAASRQRPTQGLSRGEAVRVVKQKFSDIEERLRAMESHVTSSRFELQREFKELGDDQQGSSMS